MSSVVPALTVISLREIGIQKLLVYTSGFQSPNGDRSKMIIQSTQLSILPDTPHSPDAQTVGTSWRVRKMAGRRRPEPASEQSGREDAQWLE